MKTKVIIFLQSIIISGFGNFNLVSAQNSVLAIISDNKNEFYVGIDSPLTIDVGGSAGKTKTAIASETITGNNGKYIVKIAKKVKATDEVLIGGEKVLIQEFNLNISKSELEKIGNVFFGFENFPSNLNYIFEVYLFNLCIKSTQGIYKNDMKYNNISDATKAMKAVFKICKPGEKIYITNIQVKAPAGLRKIPSINITVK